MQGLVRWRARLYGRARSSLFGASLSLASRHCATVPTEDDVRKAYKILGVDTSATLADVKKRYGDLAKEHHPDVSNSSSASSTNRMTDINNAYNTVKRFHQAGRRIFEATHASNTREAPSSSSSYYTKQDSEYQPWYEDMDPLMYELMWEEMRRQNEEDVFARSASAEGFFRPNDQWRPPRNNSSARPRRAPGQGDSGQSQGKKNSSSTTWPEEQVKAMVNMYQDGRSFEFIANALGKPSAASVVEEFNRWSSDNQPQRRRGGKSFNTKRHRSHGGHGSFYYTESPDEVPFELYEMEEDAYCDGPAEDVENSFGYYAPDEEAFDMPYPRPTPFYGMHQMSRAPAPYGCSDERGGRGYNSSRKVSQRPTRSNRGGPPNKHKRYSTPSSNSRGSGGGFYANNSKNHNSGGGKK
ncbi:hypothetical protein JKF63_06903 [Porcisia hertigi]|uniref:J domain-containing protein n=1 Tax=Porcisia hertigi TaxID=2761500 RepID=A0A836LJB9_9TRYP|nr:hypothetical protein JKF63_06903 [Porcisia hertigi]